MVQMSRKCNYDDDDNDRFDGMDEDGGKEEKGKVWWWAATEICVLNLNNMICSLFPHTYNSFSLFSLSKFRMGINIRKKIPKNFPSSQLSIPIPLFFKKMEREEGVVVTKTNGSKSRTILVVGQFLPVFRSREKTCWRVRERQWRY